MCLIKGDDILKIPRGRFLTQKSASVIQNSFCKLFFDTLMLLKA